MLEKKRGSRIKIKRIAIVNLVIGLSLNLVSCGNTTKLNRGKDIKGNWYISKNTVLKNFYYQEAYFDDKEVYFFTTQPNKIYFSNGYSYSGDSLFFLANDGKDTINNFSIFYRGDTFKIKTDKGVIEYTRIKGDKTLSNLVLDKITKKEFEEAFIKRMNNN